MDLIEYVALLRRRWIAIVVLAFSGAALGFGLAKATPPTYQATSKVFVSAENGDTASDLVQGSTFTQNLVQSYAQLVTTPAVLEPVAFELDLDSDARELSKRVSATTPLDTVIIEISATSGNAVEAASIANAVAEQLPRTVERVSPSSRAGLSSISVETISEATVPVVPISPNTRFITATGAAAGIALAILSIVLWKLLDTKIRDRRDIEQVSQAPVLGEVPRWRGSDKKQVALTRDPRGDRAEAYRRVRSNFEFVTVAGDSSAFVVTSAQRAEGKTTTAVNLALAMAEQHKKVVLVDADLRRPTVAGIARLEGSVGLTTVLIGRASIEDVTQPWGDSMLDVIPSGAVPPNPLQLLDSDAMFKLLNELRLRYDVVVLDAPPLLAVADAAVLCKHTDGAVLTVSAGKTTRAQLRAAVDGLTVANTGVLGVILTRVKPTSSQTY